MLYGIFEDGKIKGIKFNCPEIFPYFCALLCCRNSRLNIDKKVTQEEKWRRCRTDKFGRLCQCRSCRNNSENLKFEFLVTCNEGCSSRRIKAQYRLAPLCTDRHVCQSHPGSEQNVVHIERREKYWQHRDCRMQRECWCARTWRLGKVSTGTAFVPIATD